MRNVEKGTDRPAEAVDQRCGCVGNGKTRMRRPEHHRFACVPVLRVVRDFFEICPDQFQRGQRQRLGMGITVAVDQRFQRMG
ncbi:hypothetical protein D3C80_1706250 [compost metagenome]